jgi:hypothetical protein
MEIQLIECCRSGGEMLLLEVAIDMPFGDEEV